MARKGGMKETPIEIDAIYVPASRKGEIDPQRVETIAESIIEEGLKQPLQVRHDPERSRYVLVAGLQRLEAMKALGETEVSCLVVQARQR